MKKLLLLFFLTPVLAFSQNTEGRVVYEMKVDVHKRIPPERARMKEFIPQFQTMQFELLFTEKEALYRELIQTEAPAAGGRGGGRGRMMRMMMGGNSVVYRNFEEEKVVEQREFMGKNFTITEDLDQKGWKVSGEQQEIAGLLCFKAELPDTSVENSITAWFTPNIPLAAGPARYAQLPGLVLEVSNGDRSMVIQARQLEFTPIDADDLKAPKRGKEVTMDEFNEMVRKQGDMMRQQRGNRGGPGGPPPGGRGNE